MGLSIKIENLRATAQIGQCFRCQKYGHSQSCCNADIKCVVCSENHRASDCELIKGKDTPRCVNYNGEHVASYRGCPKAPKPKKPAENFKTLQLSYTDAVKANTNSQKPDNIQHMLVAANKMIIQMS